MSSKQPLPTLDDLVVTEAKLISILSEFGAVAVDDLVRVFKKALNDPTNKAKNREDFRNIIDRITCIDEESTPTRKLLRLKPDLAPAPAAKKASATPSPASAAAPTAAASAPKVVSPKRVSTASSAPADNRLSAAAELERKAQEKKEREERERKEREAKEARERAKAKQEAEAAATAAKAKKEQEEAEAAAKAKQAQDAAKAKQEADAAAAAAAAKARKEQEEADAAASAAAKAKAKAEEDAARAQSTAGAASAAKAKYEQQIATATAAAAAAPSVVTPLHAAKENEEPPRSHVRAAVQEAEKRQSHHDSPVKGKVPLAGDGQLAKSPSNLHLMPTRGQERSPRMSRRSTDMLLDSMRSKSNTSILSNGSFISHDSEQEIYYDTRTFRYQRLRSMKGQADERMRRASTDRMILPYQKRWMRAACTCDIAEVRVILRQNPLAVSLKDPFTGYTALHWAAKKGNVEMMDVLLSEEKEIDVNAKSFGGYTPLHLACMQGHAAAAARLRAARASDDVPNNDGLLPADVDMHKGMGHIPLIPQAPVDEEPLSLRDEVLPLANAGKSKFVKKPSEDKLLAASATGSTASIAMRPRASAMAPEPGSPKTSMSKRLKNMIHKKKHSGSEHEHASGDTGSRQQRPSGDGPAAMVPASSGALFSPPPGAPEFTFVERRRYAMDDINEAPEKGGSTSPMLRRVKNALQRTGSVLSSRSTTSKARSSATGSAAKPAAPNSDEEEEEEEEEEHTNKAPGQDEEEEEEEQEEEEGEEDTQSRTGTGFVLSGEGFTLNQDQGEDTQGEDLDEDTKKAGYVMLGNIDTDELNLGGEMESYSIVDDPDIKRAMMLAGSSSSSIS